MLFRGTGLSGTAGAVGSPAEVQRVADGDERGSIGVRSYTSADSSTTQSFEQRMAQLDDRRSTPSPSGMATTAEAHGHRSTRALLSPGYQLFPTGQGGDGMSEEEAPLDSDGGQPGAGAPQSLSLVGSLVSNEEGHLGNGGGGTRQGLGSSHRAIANTTTATATVAEDDIGDGDDDYLAALLIDIERHAARLDTQFHRYPSADSLKQQHQQMTATPPLLNTACATEGTLRKTLSLEEEREDGSSTPMGNTRSANKSSASVGDAITVPDSSATSHSAGTKLFLGGLRYEVIQSGRHTVSWIFQVACGVRINPSSILIHRKTKNGRSNVAPTGCASVFIADDADVAALLDMNQRIYCAEEGVYVSPSPEVMKELIASKDIVDVTGGRVRGPTHPVVIERAYSVSHHNGHHGISSTGRAANGAGGASTSSGTTHAGAGGSVGGGAGNAHRHRSCASATSGDSVASNQRMGGMPPPYSGSLPPQYGTSGMTPMMGAYQPPSYGPSSVGTSLSTLTPVLLPGLGSSRAGYPAGTVPLSGTSTPSTQPLQGGPRRSPSCTDPAGGVPHILDPQRVTFHPYLGEDKLQRRSTEVVKSAAYIVLFMAALPAESTEDYVSWLFSLMAITLAPSRIHLLGDGGLFTSGSAVNPHGGTMATGSAAGHHEPTAMKAPASSFSSLPSPPMLSTGASSCCATVSVAESDVLIALNFHHRVLCTSRGVWIGHSAQDIAALRSSDPNLHGTAPLHVDRRMGPVSGAVPPSSPANTKAHNYDPTIVQPPSLSTAAPPMMTAIPASYPLSLTMAYPISAGAMPPPPPSAYARFFPTAGAPGLPMPGTGTTSWGFPPAPPGAAMRSAGSGVEHGYGPCPPPPPPPPFGFTQRVTIGDRTYDLPTGPAGASAAGATAATPYMPVMSPDTRYGMKSMMAASPGGAPAKGGSSPRTHASPPPPAPILREGTFTVRGGPVPDNSWASPPYPVAARPAREGPGHGTNGDKG